MGILVLIVVAILFLAVIGLGWNTFLEGVMKGADKVGITSIIENATSGQRDYEEHIKGYN
jgi:hypothetical protein